MLVAVALFWKWWSLKRREPDEISKIIIGSLFTIAGGLCLFMAAATQPAGGKIGLFWPVMFHLLNSIGFAHVLPISLALFSKIAPQAITATVIGLYYLAFFAANKIVGQVGGLYSSLPTTDLLADPCRQRGDRPRRLRPVQGLHGQAPRPARAGGRSVRLGDAPGRGALGGSGKRVMKRSAIARSPSIFSAPSGLQRRPAARRHRRRRRPRRARPRR